MTLDPILSAPAVVVVHTVAALCALVLGPVALWRRRRDAIHRATGRLWVAAMAVAALSAAAIPSHGMAIVGPVGPIHALVPVVLWTLVSAIRHIRAGRVAAHAAAMRGLYWQALGIAGLFTLMPGRTINRALFPATPDAGWIVIAAGGAGLLAVWLRGRRRAQA